MGKPARRRRQPRRHDAAGAAAFAGLHLQAARTEAKLHELLIAEVARLLGARRVLLVLCRGATRAIGAALLPPGESAWSLLQAVRPWLDQATEQRTASLRHGGLMSYATSFTASFRRAAAYVDKILEGADPGDLPIEQPTRFELVVNRKTAKAIGITFPHSVLLPADRVIA